MIVDPKSSKFWEARYGKTLSSSEIHDLNFNLTGFFDLLMKWDRGAASGTLSPSGSGGF